MAYARDGNIPTRAAICDRGENCFVSPDVAVMLIISSALAVCLLGQGGSPLRLQVDIAFAGMPVPPQVRDEAIMEIALIWAKYGVDIGTVGVNDSGRGDAVRLSVVLARTPRRQVVVEVLGSIQFIGDQPLPAIVMYPDAIARIISGAARLRSEYRDWSSGYRDRILGRVLGRALAHEIGHFLLRSRRHTATGLMRARQPAFVLLARERNRLVLPPEEERQLVPPSSMAWTTAGCAGGSRTTQEIGGRGK